MCLGGGGRGSGVGSCLGFESRLHVDREGRAGGEMEEKQRWGGVNEGDVLVVGEETFVRISFAGDDKRLP